MLDGKYEIISQRPLGSRNTLFDATAPSGAAVQVAWYSVEASEEAAFERYRTLLRKLKRENLAAIYDLVARPGAHYVAWYVPTEQAKSKSSEQRLTIESILEAHGWSLDDAHICADEEGFKVYGLAFERAELERPVDAQRRTYVAQPVVAAPRQRQRTQPWFGLLRQAWLPGFVFALLGAGLLASSLYHPLERNFIVVPNVRGSEIDEALRALQKLGLEASSSPVASSERAGQVLSSEPSAGAQLRPGRSVRVRYALPPGQLAPTDVPELAGLSVSEAERQLSSAGLELGDLSRIHSARPNGAVIAQSWEGQAPTGSAVDLLVSEGPQGELTFLPDLTGLSLEDAKAIVRAAGLAQPEIERLSGTGGRANLVVAQNIAPNQLLDRDAAALRLTVTGNAAQSSTPGNTSGVPNFVGMTLDDARRLARREGLQVQSRELSSARLPLGVVTQDPAPGTALAGQSVLLTLNKPPQLVPTPNVAAEVRPGEPRRLPYSWRIQDGIPEQLAQVTVQTLSGEQELIAAQRVRGGERIEGSWQTSEPGPVTFTLTLDGLRYGERITVNP